MNKKSKSHSTQKQHLQPLLDFLNSDIDSLSESEFLALVLSYLKFIDPSNRNFIDTQTKFQKFTEGLPERPNSKTLLQKKQIFKGLQSYLRLKFETIIKSSEKGKPMLDKELIKMKGTRTVAIDLNSDRFIDEFLPETLQSTGDINLRSEKLLSKMVFVDMLRDHELKPKRFGFCAREECGNLFYQYTGLEKKYCSNRCAAADRQDRFQSDRKDKKKKA